MTVVSETTRRAHRELRSGLPLDAVKYWLVCARWSRGRFIAWRSHCMLPPKLFLDEFIIRSFISGELQSEGRAPMARPAGSTGSRGSGSIPELFPILAYALFAARSSSRSRGGRSRDVLPRARMVCGSLLLGAVYLSQYSKEFFVLPAGDLLLLAARRPRAEIAWIALALLYATFVRQYWFLVVVLYHRVPRSSFRDSDPRGCWCPSSWPDTPPWSSCSSSSSARR